MSRQNTQAGIGKSLDAVIAQYATQLSAAMFAVVGITGVLMFFHLYKGEVEGIHEWLGLAFAVAVIAHLVRNRRPFMYMLGQARMRVLLLVGATGSLGFILLSPPQQANPFRQATQRVLAAPINDVAPVLGVTGEDALRRLRSAGIAEASPEQSIGALARQYKKDPALLLGAVMAEQGGKPGPDR
ncbi:MAG TPA: DUF4405 domain-containing protein [Noviherbaspirillum sp.]|nr:DUF4405 domain-containing protein [Noviherbaspirillum sp.]